MDYVCRSRRSCTLIADILGVARPGRLTNEGSSLVARRRPRRDPSAPPVPVELSLRRSAAAKISWANTVDRRKRNEPASEGPLATFIAKVPPEITDPAERRARGKELRAAYYRQLSAKAVEARRRKREARQQAAEADGQAS